jgi:hypothetical protein
MEEARGTGGRHTAPLEAILIDANVWDSMKQTEVQALKKLVNLISKAGEDTDERRLGRRLLVRMDPERGIPMFEVEDAGTEPTGSNDFDAALAEAQERGVSRAVEILSGREMLSAADFAKYIGVSREAVRAKHQRDEILGIRGAKRGLRFPKWQVTPNGKLLPDLPQLFKLLGGDSWTVYRFLIQHHPELEGDTALSALLRGKVEKDSNRAKSSSRRSEPEPSGTGCIRLTTLTRLGLVSRRAGLAIRASLCLRRIVSGLSILVHRSKSAFSNES